MSGSLIGEIWNLVSIMAQNTLPFIVKEKERSKKFFLFIVGEEGLKKNRRRKNVPSPNI